MVGWSGTDHELVLLPFIAVWLSRRLIQHELAVMSRKLHVFLAVCAHHRKLFCPFMH